MLLPDGDDGGVAAPAMGGRRSGPSPTRVTARVAAGELENNIGGRTHVGLLLPSATASPRLQKQPLVRIDQDESGRKALVLWPRRVTVHTGNVRGARRTGIFGSGGVEGGREEEEGGRLGG